MAVRIGSNIVSLQAQRRLGEATATVTSSLARLSSGQRITKPSDDAVGLAIADTLRSRRNVYDRGAMNVYDGISLLDIADAALGELAGLTTRILELAEQGANGGYSLAQRTAIDTEAQRLRDEFFRITSSTQFNGIKVFDGSVQGLRIQSGFGVDGGITASLGGKLGTGFVQTSSNFATGGNATGFATADFNGDGNLDIVSSNNGGTSLQFLSGLGNGSFTLSSNLAAGTSTVAVAAGDFNNDGAMDIVAASGSTTLSLFLNNRAGGFNAATSITTSGNATALTAIDINRDGAMDIVVAQDNAGTDTVAVLRGNGAGGFGTATDFSLGAGVSPTIIDKADFNGDGVTDIIVGGGGNAAALLGNGGSGFGTATSVATGGVAALTVGDFNGDGYADLATVSGVTADVALFFRVSNGGAFGGATEVAFTGVPTGTLSSIASGDLNGDGTNDLVATDELGFSFVALGDGRGNFAENTTDSGAAYTNHKVVDVNGDGVLDVIGVDGGVTSLIYRTRDGINPISPFSLRTQADARQAIAPLTRKLEELNKQRGVVGSFQSRLTSAAFTARSQSDGFRGAESRIRDVDVAQETTRLVGAQIRQQAATAVLTQANLQPTVALRLLSRS